MATSHRTAQAKNVEIASDSLIDSLFKHAKLLDSAFTIPGTTMRVGYDSIVGIIPGIGDVAGLLLSGSLLFRARKLGLKKLTWARMAFNIGMESVVGTIPLLGDVFDAWFKSNQRNVELIRKDLAKQPARRSQRSTQVKRSVTAVSPS